MTQRKTILVLEDMRERVDWLTAKFPNAKVIWTKQVGEFLQELTRTNPDELALVVLDHDIGGPFTGSTDTEGKTGMDAVRELEHTHGAPVIVWSINKDGWRLMVPTLIEKGVVAVSIPFLRENLWNLQRAIAAEVE